VLKKLIMQLKNIIAKQKKIVGVLNEKRCNTINLL